MEAIERIRHHKKIYNDLKRKGYAVWYNKQKGVKEFGLPKEKGGFIHPTIGYINNDTFEIVYY
ncbi:MAG: hypothetical protein RR585_01810 [Coprobacillus sp.]